MLDELFLLRIGQPVLGPFTVPDLVFFGLGIAIIIVTIISSWPRGPRPPAVPSERWANSGTNNELLPNQVVL